MKRSIPLVLFLMSPCSFAEEPQSLICKGATISFESVVTWEGESQKETLKATIDGEPARVTRSEFGDSEGDSAQIMLASRRASAVLTIDQRKMWSHKGSGAVDLELPANYAVKPFARRGKVRCVLHMPASE